MDAQIQIELNVKIENAIRSFEAYLYDKDNQQTSDKLSLTRKFVEESKQCWSDLDSHNISGYFDDVLNLLDALAENRISNESDAHDVVIGALNQLINYYLSLIHI